MRPKQTNLHLQDIVEPSQETQKEITADPKDAQKEIFTPTEDLSISQNTAGVKFRCPRPWLGGVETARRYKRKTCQPETGRVKKVVSENGKKYLQLSGEEVGDGN